MPIARCFRVLLTAACLLLALPALASSAVYEVDTVVDLTSGAGKECGAGEECSLRVALQKSNASTSVTDTIRFDATVFQGGSSETIFPATMLPTITSPVEIDGGICETAALVEGPCVGVQGPAGESVFRVEADDTTIRGLAIQGGSFGINVLDGSGGFLLQGSWIGFNLEGGPSGNTIGVFIDPGSDGATIGGTEAVERNVFGNNGNGLDLEGASETTVQGNYFGVEPDGSSPAANFRDIEATDSIASGGFAAKNTEIGATISAEAAATADCDGGCNVIADASIAAGIDLQGDGSGQNEAPATGPTTIHGNYVGLDAAGTGVVGQGTYGINAGAADDVLVGGSAPGDTNFIAGGSFGVYGENGDDLDVLGNVIGKGPTGVAVTPPQMAGIFAFALTLDDPEASALIESNTIRMVSGAGIDHSFIGATIVDNTVEGESEVGIYSEGDGEGSLISGNIVKGGEVAGIEVRNPGNEILGNEVFDSEEAGIVVSPLGEINVSGNVIGGDSAAEENAIFGSGGGAIEIYGIEESRNEARRNRGSGNEEGWLRLRSAGASEPGNGVEPPEITTAGKTETSGTAEPGAVVRVFRKEKEEAGEIAGFVGQATADVSGQWKATYAGLPEGSVLTATQTLDGGTSELSGTAKTPPDPPAPPSGCPAVPSACPPPPPAVTKPKVTIKKAPKAKSKSTTAKFVFSADKSGVTFKCKLDKKAFANCKSPKTYKKLKPGKHVFKVKATNSAGTSPVVTRKFTVLPPS